MKTAFLGNFGARPAVWEAILAKTTEKLDVSVLFLVEIQARDAHDQVLPVVALLAVTDHLLVVGRMKPQARVRL